MKIYNYKPDSLLNSKLARVFNSIIMGLILFIFAFNTFHVEINKIEGMALAIIIIYTIGSTLLGLSHILSQNKWYGVDKKEESKKESFIMRYCFVSSILSFIIALAVALAIYVYNISYNYDWVLIFIIGYLIFNRFNICSLYNYNNFFEETFPLYDCDDLDMIKYVLQRDHYIELDYIRHELKKYREKEQKEKREG